MPDADPDTPGAQPLPVGNNVWYPRQDQGFIDIVTTTPGRNLDSDDVTIPTRFVPFRSRPGWSGLTLENGVPYEFRFRRPAQGTLADTGWLNAGTATPTDGTAKLLVDRTARTVPVGYTTSYVVTLNSTPDTAGVVDPKSSLPGVVEVTPDTSTWRARGDQLSPFTFTLTGRSEGTATISHTTAAVGGDYHLLQNTVGATPSVEVTVTAAPTVGNIGQAEDSVAGFAGAAYAQGFTTGPYADGYTLEEIGVDLSVRGTLSAAQIGTVKAALHSDSSSTPGTPGAKLADLTVPSTFSGDYHVFTAPDSTALEPETSYHLVLHTTGDLGELGVVTTNSDNEDGGAQPGWSIADAHSQENANVPAGTWSQMQRSMRIGVVAQQKASGNASLSALRLNASTDGSNFPGAVLHLPAEFDAAATSYTATVANDVTHVRVERATPGELAATVTAAKRGEAAATVPRNAAGTAIPLAVGSNVIDVVVTAADGLAEQTYTFTIERRTPLPALSMRMVTVWPRDAGASVQWELAAGVCFANLRYRVTDTDASTVAAEPGPWNLAGVTPPADVGTCQAHRFMSVSGLINGLTYEVQGLGIDNAADSYLDWSNSLTFTPTGTVDAAGGVERADRRHEQRRQQLRRHAHAQPGVRRRLHLLCCQRLGCLGQPRGFHADGGC